MTAEKILRSPIADRARMQVQQDVRDLNRALASKSDHGHVAQTDNEKVGEHLRKLRPWAKDAVMGWEPGTTWPAPLNVIADEEKLAVHRAKIDRSVLTDTKGAFGFDE